MGKIRGLGSGSAPLAALTVSPPPYTPSAQQETIWNYVSTQPGNLVIEALAGTGKTSTLVELCKRIDKGVYLAFNKPIAAEVERRLADAGIDKKRVAAKTFHAIGYQAWARHAPPAVKNVDGQKLSTLCDMLGMPRSYHQFATRLVSLAKQHLVGALPDLPMDDDTSWLPLVERHDLLLETMPRGDEELDPDEFLEHGLAWSMKLLERSIRDSTQWIDFDDMIYMPMYCKLRLWQYDWVLVDEAQDTNRARREVAERLLSPNGRLIAVGDRHQAIYGFTGADADALSRIERHFQAETLPLTVTYRCPLRVVELAQQLVPALEARPDAPDGQVLTMPWQEFAALKPLPTDAILCRVMRPLASLAFSYWRRHIACAIEGREIGQSLIALARRWKRNTIEELNARLAEYVIEERTRLESQGKLAQLGAVLDKVATLEALGEGLGAQAHPEELVRVIEQLFKDTDGSFKKVTTLATIHKAKGREWDRVFILGRKQLMPSPFAKQEWQLEQERNLEYVAITRAQRVLVDVTVPS
jgi:DNA helicase-2/ATP-dependent DNA helicase PcrA